MQKMMRNKSHEKSDKKQQQKNACAKTCAYWRNERAKHKKSAMRNKKMLAQKHAHIGAMNMKMLQ